MSADVLPIFDGLTWSHPRGHAPLARLAQVADVAGELGVPHSRLRWHAQDLAGFESHPIDTLAARYDLIVLDHPGLGAAVAAEALVALDEVFKPAELRAWREATVGASYDSYTYGGHQWALPIDAATQVCALRPDLLGDAAPTSWDGWLGCDPELRIAIPTADPHTLLTFLGIAAAHEPRWRPDGRRLVPREQAVAAYALLSRAVARTPEDLRGLDPIQLLDRMAREPIAGIPLVYGYVTYSAVTEGLARIRFADAPGLDPDGTPGSVLGGTGLAVSARARGNPLLLDHLRQAMHPAAQRHLIPNAGGQPSAVAAWQDPGVNAARWDFYTATRRSIDHAWTRPRFAGWIAVQRDGSAILRDAVLTGRPAAEALDDLDACYRSHLPSLSGEIT